MTTSQQSLYDLAAPALDGADGALAELRGRVTLVVNVASECGFTPQYAGLQALHAELAPRGFAVLGFPSNEFGGQEPGDADAIRVFCTTRFGVGFPLFAKCATRPGPDQSPVYRLVAEALGETPRWNFAKVLVGRDGRPRRFFDSGTAPDDPELRAAIEAALEEPAP
jgi:glutathione peroxidase